MPDRQYNSGDEKVCGGCSKRVVVWGSLVCQPYAHPMKTYGHRFGECALNPKFHESKKDRVREGQKKNKRIGG
jgi:hypothetical protein